MKLNYCGCHHLTDVKKFHKNIFWLGTLILLSLKVPILAIFKEQLLALHLIEKPIEGHSTVRLG